MRKASLFLLLSVISLSIFAQKGEKAIGINFGYGSEIKSPAFGLKFNYGITDQIRISPSFNYFLKKDGLSEWDVNADVHYLFNVSPKVNVYPLVGLTYTGWVFDWGGLFDDWGDIEDEDDEGSPSSTVTRLGVNVGGGIGYQLTDKIALGLEVKYSVVSDFDQFVPSVNLTYKF